jgi:hypothetical protein
MGLQAILVSAIIAALVMGLALAPGRPFPASHALAAKDEGSGDDPDVVDRSRPANWRGREEHVARAGQAIDFAKAYPSNVNNPRVDLLCYQASDPSSLTMYVPGLGYLVYGETRSATPNSADYIGDNPFVLGCGMSAWLLNGGSADGTANLFYFG